MFWDAGDIYPELYRWADNGGNLSEIPALPAGAEQLPSSPNSPTSSSFPAPPWVGEPTTMTPWETIEPMPPETPVRPLVKWDYSNFTGTEKTCIEWIGMLPPGYKEAAMATLQFSDISNSKTTSMEDAIGNTHTSSSHFGCDFMSQWWRTIHRSEPWHPLTERYLKIQMKADKISKTVAEWIEELPEPHKTLFKNNNTRNQNQSVFSLTEAINMGLNWGNSNEGGDFWEKTHSHFRNPTNPLPQLDWSFYFNRTTPAQKIIMAKAFVKLALGEVHPREVKQFIQKEWEKVK